MIGAAIGSRAHVLRAGARCGHRRRAAGAAFISMNEISLAADLDRNRVLGGAAITPHHNTDDLDLRVGYALLDLRCIENQETIVVRYARSAVRIGSTRTRNRKIG